MTNLTEFQDTIKSAIQSIEEHYANRSAAAYLKLGIAELDQKLLGFAPGELTTINSFGQTDLLNFAQKCVIDVVTTQGKSALVYSGGIPADHYTKRILSRISNIGLLELERGELKNSEWPALAETLALLNDATLWFADGAPAFKDISDNLRESFVELSTKPDLVLIHTTEQSFKSRDSSHLIKLKQTAEELGSTVWIVVDLSPSMGPKLNAKKSRTDFIPEGLENHSVDKILFLLPSNLQ